MQGVPSYSDPRLLVGTETADDAGVYLLTDDLAIVQTVDVFTPVIDDPNRFGQIVAANCMSDVWAMGGDVLTALNLFGYPPKKLDAEVAAEILRGVGDKVTEAGGVLCGGHTWMDPELRVGLSVTGRIHPQKIVTNAGARPGDALILTKAIGAGILSYAAIQGKIGEDAIEPVIRSMTALNKTASEIMVEFGATACTDVTGFSLLGHACEMAQGSGYDMEIDVGCVPVFEGALEYASKGIVLPLGSQNRASFSKQVKIPKHLDQEMIRVLFDPQTSGGLLIAIPGNNSDRFLRKLHGEGITSATEIGMVLDTPGEKIILVDGSC